MRAAAIVYLLLALGACGSKSGGAAACGHVTTIDDGRPGACRAVRSNVCSAREYAITCGPGGRPPPDAGSVFVYDDPPPTCELVDVGIGLPSLYCCPCLE